MGEYVTGAHVSGMPVVIADRSGSPVAAPLMSLQLTASSMLVRKSASVPTVNLSPFIGRDAPQDAAIIRLRISVYAA